MATSSQSVERFLDEEVYDAFPINPPYPGMETGEERLATKKRANESPAPHLTAAFAFVILTLCAGGVFLPEKAVEAVNFLDQNPGSDLILLGTIGGTVIFALLAGSRRIKPH